MSNLDNLLADWIEAKKAETLANRQRLAIEEQIVEAMDVPAEGSKTHKLDNYKVTLTQPVARKLDEKTWAQVKDLIPSDMAPIKVKVDADATGCKWLAQNEPDLWAKIAPAFETKPGKVGVKVEAL